MAAPLISYGSHGASTSRLVLSEMLSSRAAGRTARNLCGTQTSRAFATTSNQQAAAASSSKKDDGSAKKQKGHVARIVKRNDDWGEMSKFRFDDVPTAGHDMLHRGRFLLKYARITELEMPKLRAFSTPFNPPSPSDFLRFRFQHYQGEHHPASRKVVLQIPINSLFKSGILKTESAKHKFLLLAGNRYDPDAGASERGLEWSTQESEEARADTGSSEDGLGEVKISCELFPVDRQNMKWCSDVLDKLIAEANSGPDMSDIPLDPRHHLVRESKRGGFKRHRAVTLKDFPQQWL